MKIFKLCAEALESAALSQKPGPLPYIVNFGGTLSHPVIQRFERLHMTSVGPFLS